jgi:hypothetical protein
MAGALAVPRWHFQPPSQGWPRNLLLITLAFLASMMLAGRRRSQALLMASVMVVMLATACGGGGGGGSPPPPSSGATPAGTYQLTVRATSGTGLAQAVELTLIVR